MKNKKEFLDKRNDSFQAGQLHSSVPSLESSIKEYSKKLTDSFLKDTLFFDGLERELISSLDDIGKGKTISYGRTSQNRLSTVNQSLLNLRHSKNVCSGFGSVDRPLRTPAFSALANSNEKLSGKDVKNQSCSTTILDTFETLETASDIDLRLHSGSSQKTSETRFVECDSKITHDLNDKLDDSLDKSHQINSFQSIREEKQDLILKSKLSNKKDSSALPLDSLEELETDETVASFPDKQRGRDVFLDNSQDISVKSKKIPSVNIESVGKLETDDCYLFQRNSQQRRKIESDCTVDDDLALDLGGIEKELLLISNSDKVSNASMSFDEPVNQQKVSFDAQKTKEEHLFFDLKKIVDIEESPKELDDFPVSSLPLVDEETTSVENANLSLEKEMSALSFEEDSKKSFPHNNFEGIEQGLSLNEDYALGEETNDRNLFSSQESSIDIDADHHDSLLTSSTVENHLKKDPVNSRKLLLIGYILLVIGCGAYWFFQLHREIDYAGRDPRIINATKDPVKVLPDSSVDENDASFNKVNEVYDRFSGKKPSYPKQKKLLDLQEEPMNIPAENKEDHSE
ncbi:hypothetical protein [Candidatus Liberibacter solanacearum]|uniref:Transmembrane protein n=1 Tax=Candidatus Liberibacter solanacearum TaxID=556287 RepID=A0A1V2N935_9HYPH|nr:hypothetical protein [Candidatus Liberibacter solanacearum]ONI58570.1 hypothetical protein AYJ09_05310 [Candidatus Liberibacter solanacearum]ONI60183.1 hypothetical protein AYO25_01175 [Candidatus Liberibacter solanacearum]